MIIQGFCVFASDSNNTYLKLAERPHLEEAGELLYSNDMTVFESRELAQAAVNRTIAGRTRRGSQITDFSIRPIKVEVVQ